MKIKEVKSYYVSHNVNIDNSIPFNAPNKIFELFNLLDLNPDTEIFKIFYFSNNLKLLGFNDYRCGGIAECAVNIRDIIKYTILTGANNIILAHNHPSGNLEISKEDLNITKKLNSACDIFNINLLDHIVIDCNSKQFKSFKELNIL